MLTETSGQVLEIGDKVRMNIAQIEKGDMDGVEFTTTGKNYWRYMNEHPNEVYTITGLDFDTGDTTSYELSGEMAGENWYSEELIHVPEAASNFEIIKNMTIEEMAKDLIPMLHEILEDGIPSENSLLHWLNKKPDAGQ